MYFSLFNNSVFFSLFLVTMMSSSSLFACSNESIRELNKAIEMHNEHAYRLNKKFRDIWYHQGPVPLEVRKAVTLDSIKNYLALLGKRKAAVLLHGFRKDRLWSWLITFDGKLVCGQPVWLSGKRKNILKPNNWSMLGVRGVKHPRMVVSVSKKDQSIPEYDKQQWKSVLENLSDVLLPEKIQSKLKLSKIDTLIVMPISVREFNPKYDSDLESATLVTKDRSAIRAPAVHVALSIGIVPFAALPFGGDILVNKMSVIIAPGFFQFSGKPRKVRKKYQDPIVVGNPVGSGFQALPGAEQEAQLVANIMQTDRLFLKKHAKMTILEGYLRENHQTVDYIHLATHGVADAVNPVDQSYLVFSDGLWSARQISQLRKPNSSISDKVNEDMPLLVQKPLVVMSACQTALGKDFPAGTIGLARAWHWAGASNVLMSLWSVDDDATRDLMEDFSKNIAKGMPVDKALQSAMQITRGKYPDPSYWASFSIYGSPEKL